MTTNVHAGKDTIELFRNHQGAKMLINLVMKDAFINFYPGSGGASMDRQAVSVLMALGIAFKKVPDAVACVNPKEWRRGERDGYLAVHVFGVFWNDLVRRTLESTLLRMGFMCLPDPAPQVNEEMGGVVLDPKHTNIIRRRFAPCPPTMDVDRCTRLGMAFMNEMRRRKVTPVNVAVESLDGGTLLSAPASPSAPLEKSFQINAGSARIEEKSFALKGRAMPKEKAFSMNTGSNRIEEKQFKFSVPRTGNVFKGESKAAPGEDPLETARLTVEACEILDRHHHVPEEEFVGEWNGFLSRPMPVLPVDGMPDDPDFAAMCEEAALDNLLTTLCPGDAVHCGAPVPAPETVRSPEKFTYTADPVHAGKLLVSPGNAPIRNETLHLAGSTTPAPDRPAAPRHTPPPPAAKSRKQPELRAQPPEPAVSEHSYRDSGREVLNEFIDWEDQLPPEAFDSRACEDIAHTLVVEAKPSFVETGHNRVRR